MRNKCFWLASVWNLSSFKPLPRAKFIDRKKKIKTNIPQDGALLEREGIFLSVGLCITAARACTQRQSQGMWGGHTEPSWLQEPAWPGRWAQLCWVCSSGGAECPCPLDGAVRDRAAGKSFGAFWGCGVGLSVCLFVCWLVVCCLFVCLFPQLP